MHTNRLQLGDVNLICSIWCEYLFVSVMLFKVYKAAFLLLFTTASVLLLGIFCCGYFYFV